MDFAEKLGMLIYRKGDSLLALSRSGVGVSDTTLKRYLEGRSPRLEDLVKVARFFKVPVAYLADDAILDPADVAGVESLCEAERTVIKNARALGVEDAGMVLRLIGQMGINEALSRLIGPPRGSVESGEEFCGNHGPVGVRDNHGRSERPKGEHHGSQSHPLQRA